MSCGGGLGGMSCARRGACATTGPAVRRATTAAAGRGSQMSLRSRQRRQSSNSMGLRSRLLSRQRSA